MRIVAATAGKVAAGPGVGAETPCPGTYRPAVPGRGHPALMWTAIAR